MRKEPRDEVKLGASTIPMAVKADLTPKEFRRAVYFTLCLSLPGLLAIACSIFGLKETLKLAASIPVPIFVGYLAMVFVIERVAVPHRDHFHFFCVGVPFAVLLFISGLFAGSTVSMLLYPSAGLFVNLMGVLVVGSFVGALPAAVFGMIGTCILRKLRNGTLPGELHLEQP